MHENIRHCGTHKARSTWIKAPLLHSAGITTPPMTTAPGGICLDCAKPLLRDPYGQCLVCERGVHLAYLAEKLDPALLYEEDPYIACARCFTEAFDEVTAFRFLDPHRQVLMLDTEEAWGSSTNQDVFHDYVLPVIATQPEVHRLDR
eukprot:9488595-Pyramimonas_sp.AAC.1